MARHKRIHQMTVRQWEAAFPTDDACKAYLVRHRWPLGVHCPRCGNVEVAQHGTRAFHWQCYACSAKGTSYRFSVLVGTIFENTKYPMREWFRVIHMMLTSKKGVSALEVHRVIGTGSYRTAWSMCHRIRAALADEQFRKLIGIVEVDETFIGGKDGNRHWRKRSGGVGGEGSGKTPVIGAVERNGRVIAKVIGNVRKDTVTKFVQEAVSRKVSLLCTDGLGSYNDLFHDFPWHESVDHERGQYVVGAIHTNTIEGFWSLFKRGIIGTYHKVSRKYFRSTWPSFSSATTIGKIPISLARRSGNAEKPRGASCADRFGSDGDGCRMVGNLISGPPAKGSPHRDK